MRTPRRSVRRLLGRFAIVVAVLASAGLVWYSSYAAFTASTGNPGNGLAGGTVSISDNDSNSAMFTWAGGKPGEMQTSCITVTYTGTLPARVNLFGTTSGTGLDPYLALTVTRGSSASGFGNCTGFTPDTVDYGKGPGVVFSDTLQAYPDSYAAGIVDATPAVESWTQNESHTYRFQLIVMDNNSAQGKNVTQAFSWEARNQDNGELSLPIGTVGCTSEDGSGGPCTDGNGVIGGRGMAMSPDGKFLYSTSWHSRALTVFARDTSTGLLTQLAGASGCVSQVTTGAAGCTTSNTIDNANGVAVSPDGKSVYVAAYASGAVDVFDRNTSTGAVTQLAGTAGCVSDTGSSGMCVDGTALSGVYWVEVSPDNKNVYVGAAGGSVAIFTRNTSTGALTQLAGTAGCVSDTGTGGACVDGNALAGMRGVAISPDGTSVYAAAVSSAAVAVFSRNPSTGALTQLAGTAGCVSNTGTGAAGCASGPGLWAPRFVTVSADGANVYVLSSGMIAAFARNPSTGALTQLASTAACISWDGTTGTCADGPDGMNGAFGMGISPDGKNIYTAAGGAAGKVTFLYRNTSTGALTAQAVESVLLPGATVPLVSLDNAQVYVSVDNNNASGVWGYNRIR